MREALPPAVIERFRTIALARVERLEAAWSGLLESPNEKLAQELKRELHTLKGDAKLVGFSDVTAICHKLEELLVIADRMKYRVAEECDIVMGMALGFIAMLVRTREGAPLGGIDVQGFLRQLEETLREMPAQEESIVPRSHPRSGIGDAADGGAAQARQRLAVVATELYLEHLRAEGDARDRLKVVWQRLASEISSVGRVRLDPRVAALAEGAERLAVEIGKKTRVRCPRGAIEVRAELVEPVVTALMHGLRNAIDHGIEDPAERVRVGKPARGSVTVTVRELTSGLEIAVEDDGRGVDFARVRWRAVQCGRLTADRARSAPESELIDLLLEAGFSTVSEVSDVSGRGVGLDVIKTGIVRCGGGVEVASRAGVGFRLVITVPQERSTADVYLFRDAGNLPPIAVERGWSIQPDDGASVDPYVALGLRTESRSTRGWSLRRGDVVVRVRLAGDVEERQVVRSCPTADDQRAEIVGHGAREAILVRPTILLLGAKT